jgi:hypothetical protein
MGAALDALRGFAAAGGDIISDGGTQVDVAATKTLELTLPLRNDPGRPHNWSASIQDAHLLRASCLFPICWSSRELEGGNPLPPWIE